MSKKRKKWWETGWSGYKQNITDPLDPTEEEPGYYDYDESNYWGRKLTTQEGRTDGSYKNAQDDWKSAYKDYNKSGNWAGYNYYRQPQLSYKYVQQMANALAAQHHIKVEVGPDWEVDLQNKKLIYNPASLLYGTKGELLATLMHEMGKLRYMTHPKNLKNKYLDMYPLGATEALVVFEDVRVDYLMLKAYEGAAEIYESAIPAIERQIEKYYKNGLIFRQGVPAMLHVLFKNIIQQTAGDYEARKIAMLQTFGESDEMLVSTHIQMIEQYYKDNGSLYEYCGDMTNIMYDLERPVSGLENIKEKIELTQDAIEPAKKAISSQALVDLMDTEVYPHIEDLLKDLTNRQEQLEKMFPNMPQSVKDHIAHTIADKMRSANQGEQSTNAKGNNSSIRGSGPSDREVPPEWKTGDYLSLKSSVAGEVRQLINKLMFIRREEQTIKYTQDQKRGKLNSKKLYKMMFNSRRLFKQKLPSVDTIQSFAFSVLLDVSGSMSGERIIHSTRAVVIFNEVFKKMQIPFEVVAFSDGATVIKKFEEESTTGIERKIGGLVNANGGGTNLNRGLDKLEIKKREERNKIVVVISDGGVGDINWYNNNYFKPWREKHGIKSVGVGIQCESEILKLCEGNSKLLKTPAEVPVEFTNLIKSLFKGKR